MKAIIKKVNQAPKMVDVANELEAMQSIVGGYLEVVSVGGNLLMLCDEEGKLKGSPYNFDLGRDLIVGDVLFVQSYGEEFTDIDDSNAETVMKYFGKTPYTT